MKYEWLNKKTPRSVDLLKLWPENPRLNPEEKHILLNDFAEDLTYEDSDKKQLFKLLKSIAEDGFIPADPVVVWKNEENGKYYVAEGNRRVLALKLLREPNKAPKSIRSYIRSLSSRINVDDYDKILVNVAPTFEDAEWYINQRNSTSSLQQPWSRIQQQRWISELYDKYNGEIDKITSVTKMTQGELENFIRILKIKDLTKLDEVKSKLTQEELNNASSYKFPITILERFFSNNKVKENWGLEYEGVNIKLNNKDSFLIAYTQLIKDIVNKNPDNIIDTRTITSNLEGILNKLPKVDNTKIDSDEIENLNNNIKIEEPIIIENNANESSSPIVIKNDPNRSRIILNIYSLNTDSYRLSELFEELKKIPFSYTNCIASSIRVFLDLSIFKYIDVENLSSNLTSVYKQELKDISLKKRLEYLKQNKFPEKQKKIVEKLLNIGNEFSLDVLNGYIHSQDSHYLDKQFLNRFWDFLFPLFEYLVEIKEK
ncbi:ParB N-terminal domain-containing protein [Flavobacterium columnare]|uniref:ParB N-terminal domain-containing protein n=1 Tax=Flavobacterium columnare TaxID=996 RepID=UPI003BA2B2E8